MFTKKWLEYNVLRAQQPTTPNLKKKIVFLKKFHQLLNSEELNFSSSY